MAKGYWIVSVDVSNPESYKLYIAENRNAFRKSGARFLIRGGKSEVVEGTGRPMILMAGANLRTGKPSGIKVSSIVLGCRLRIARQSL